MFRPEEIHSLLAHAGTQMKAMILLGLNCGYGNADCGKLTMSHLDLEAGLITFPRPKTGIARRCHLWPETVEAVKQAIAERREPKDERHSDLVFITKYGTSWDKDHYASPITHEMRKLMDNVRINGHRNFYTLRHTFRTIADECRDQPAVDHIMGHESPHMSSVYRETISDERLRAVVDYVHRWLFPVENGAEIIPFAKTNAS
jgi:integrase